MPNENLDHIKVNVYKSDKGCVGFVVLWGKENETCGIFRADTPEETRRKALQHLKFSRNDSRQKGYKVYPLSSDPKSAEQIEQERLDKEALELARIARLEESHKAFEGSVWMNDGYGNRARVSPDQVEDYKSKGFQMGLGSHRLGKAGAAPVKQVSTHALTGMKWMFKGTEVKRIAPKDVEHFLSIGFKFGKKPV